MKVSLIVAKAENNVIGKNNDLVWKLSDDLKHFKKTTTGQHLIMGRKTYESMGKPLPNRTSIVVTRNEDYSVPDEHFCVQNLEQALALGKKLNLETIIIAGGGEIYKMALPYVDEMIITEVKATPEGDTFFPEINWSEWQETKREHFEKNDKNEYAFDIAFYKRK
ncbi:dihydrofolate reductase [Litoribacter ruber]|uniref:dihydrofolate reductase n=1 Tax=Litoribacter ruber TaxID=702568 RepID=UPI001BD9DD40|nr:dihydrofolate reductase [Litoribacter ruber]MBT0810754.1 dihydrofolate reductase [Litoribacter ruber]